MSGHLSQEPDLSFTVEVKIDECQKDGDSLTFPIAGGYLKAGEDFIPQLECDSIIGYDRATLTDGELQLNAVATAQQKRDPKPIEERNIKLWWHGVVKMGENEDEILKGNFQGKTGFGNPQITRFELGADDEEFSKFKNRIFQGVGRFVVKDNKVNLEYRLYQLET